jgi:tetratricopeptide (TPR) repeat protein
VRANLEHFEAYYCEGVSLSEKELIVSGRRLTEPGEETLARLRRAVHCFEQAVVLDGRSWASMWLLGKIHQRLRDHHASLHWFARAFAVRPDHADVAREASLEAMALGHGAEGVRYAEAGWRANPEDLGLLANLGLAHLIGGDLDLARKHAEEAVEGAPEDTISRALLATVTAVTEGRRPRPNKLGDLARYP